MRLAGSGGDAPAADAAPRPFSFYGLVGLVLLAPLPIGAVAQWTWASLALATAGLLCLWAWEAFRGAHVPRLGPVVPAAGCFAAVLVWAAVQAWAGTPESLHHPFWETARPLLGPHATGAISVNPPATLNGIVRLGTYAAILFLAFAHGHDPTRARLAVAGSAIAATAYAAYGLVVFLGGFETILWFPKTAYIGDLTGPLVNRNSFATYCGLGLLCLAAVLAQRFRTTRPPGLPWRERLRIRAEVLFGPGLLPLGGFAAVAFALLLTHSRGGLIAAIAGLLVFLGLYAATRAGSFRRSAMSAALGAFALAAVIVTSGDVTMIRLLNSAPEAEPRMEAYQRTIAAITDAPIAGTGLGTFRDVFQMYRTPSMDRPYFQAHNTYLDNALELGIPAALGLAAAVVWVALLCLRGALRRRRNVSYPCLGVAATALVGTHAIVDFSLQIPAVAALYFLILGVGCAQSRSSHER